MYCYAPAILNLGRGEGAYSITAVHTYICWSRPVNPVRNTFGFRAISFERIGVLD